MDGPARDLLPMIAATGFVAVSMFTDDRTWALGAVPFVLWLFWIAR